jgi:hypothetical protein
MTTKDKVLAMIQRLGIDVTYDDLIYKLEFMKAVEQGIEEADRGLLIDDDQVWAELEAEDAADQAIVDANGDRRPTRHPQARREANGAKKRTKILAKNQGRGKTL